MTREEADTLVRGTGMDDVNEFLGYVLLHSATELALFSGKQIGTMLKLVGSPHADEWLKKPDAWRSVDMSDLVTQARDRLEIGVSSAP